MKQTSHPHAEEQLAQLATQFDHWRQYRTTRAERIPPPYGRKPLHSRQCCCCRGE
jgi:hypothetical protein